MFFNAFLLFIHCFPSIAFPQLLYPYLAACRFLICFVAFQYPKKEKYPLATRYMILSVSFLRFLKLVYISSLFSVTGCCFPYLSMPYVASLCTHTHLYNLKLSIKRNLVAFSLKLVAETLLTNRISDILRETSEKK